MSDPAFTGVDAQTSMLFGYHSGAQALLTCTLRAKSPTRAAIVGTDARIEVDGDFYAPARVSLIPRKGDPVLVQGELRTGEYTDDQQVTRQTVEIVAQTILRIDYSKVAVAEPGDAAELED